MPGIIERIKVAREAGNVERCHAIPHIGSYSVGKHCFDAVSLLFILNPAPSLALVKTLLWHDCHERFLGDVPGSAKWAIPDLNRAYEEKANEIDEYYGFTDKIHQLEKGEDEWLSAIDKLELWIYCKEQEAFGNRHVEQLFKRVDDWFSQNYHEVPEPVQDVLANYQWTRIPDLGGE